jgi:hypothetical protein
MTNQEKENYEREMAVKKNARWFLGFFGGIQPDAAYLSSSGSNLKVTSMVLLAYIEAPFMIALRIVKDKNIIKEENEFSSDTFGYHFIIGIEAKIQSKVYLTTELFFNFG